MDSQKNNSSYDLSVDVKYKPSKWYTKLLSQSASRKDIYNTRLITQEYEPDVNWRMPEIEPSKIYDLPIFKFCPTTLFRYCSSNVPISLGQTVYLIPLIHQEDIEWGLQNGYKYVHLGLIQFGINPLVRPGLDTSVLTCIIDSRHNTFSDALISGFQAPLHNGPVWSSALPRYQVSLSDPYINTLLQAYVQFSGFNMAEGSKIAQLHTTICLHFVSTTMPALNPKIVQCATNESVVIGPRNVSPLTLGFAKLTEIEEWSAEYVPISSRIQPPIPRELKIETNPLGKNVLKLGRSQSTRIQDLDRQMSSLTASTLERQSSAKYSNSFRKTPVYKPVAGKSKFDDHLLTHQKGSKNCYYCKKNVPVQELSESSVNTNSESYPSAPKTFRTYQTKQEHSGQHPNCT